MILTNKYTFACLIQFYELEMLDEHIHSCVEMLSNIENSDNITFHFCISFQEKFEKIDWQYFNEKYSNEYGPIPIHDEYKIHWLKNIFLSKIGLNSFKSANLIFDYKYDNESLYTIADYRRWVNDKYCDECDVVCWSETDSLWPFETIYLLESLHNSVSDTTPKYIVNFSDRVLWDNNVSPKHPKFENVTINDELVDLASGKSYMSYEQMRIINDATTVYDVSKYDYPLFDGSCVCFSSELIKSGINIPKSILLTGEDTAIGLMAKQILRDNFIQYCFKNILHVHNRRHPRKRTGILNENNPHGFCDIRKGQWWGNIDSISKKNLNTLFTQNKIIKYDK